MSQIPFNRPYSTGKEMAYMSEAIANQHISGDGPFTKKCSALLREALGTKKVLLTTSCTHALEMSAILLDLQPGDEVIVPSFTFVSTVNAYVLRGAKPVFADVRPDTLNMDEKRLAKLVTPRTKAIVPVHYAGISCDMDAINAIAQSKNITVIEDAAHGLFGAYKGKPLGTLGAMSTFSFHETKNFSCGEGGALVINDESFTERAEIIREKGTNRSKFFRGQVDKYTWVDVGSSYLPTDLLAAFLLAQLEARDSIQAKRKLLWHRYNDSLRDWAKRNSVKLPTVPADCDQAYHMFYMVFPKEEQRDAFNRYMREHQMYSVFHYLPLHLSPFGKRFGGVEGMCPVTESITGRLTRLPFFNAMTEGEQTRVIEATLEFKF